MESRKKRNLQIERKKRAERRVTNTVVTLVLLAIVAGICFSVWDSFQRRTIGTFEGERIPTSDFNFFHAMTDTGERDPEDHREFAVNEMLTYLTLLNRAEMHGFTLPEDQLDEHMQDAANMREWLTWQDPRMLRDTSNRRIADFLSVGFLQDREWLQPGPVFDFLMEEYKGDFEPAEEDVQEFLDGIMDDIISAATDRNVKYVRNDDWDVMQEVFRELNDGEITFDTAISSHHQPPEPQFDEEGEEIILENPTEIWNFGATFGAWEFWDELLALEEGEMSEVMTFGDYFFIVKMYDKTVNYERVEEFTEEVTDSFIRESRENAFLELMDEWVAAANFEPNQRALGRI
jgi:hypothetical protein